MLVGAFGGTLSRVGRRWSRLSEVNVRSKSSELVSSCRPTVPPTSSCMLAILVAAVGRIVGRRRVGGQHRDCVLLPFNKSGDAVCSWRCLAVLEVPEIYYFSVRERLRI